VKGSHTHTHREHTPPAHTHNTHIHVHNTHTHNTDTHNTHAHNAHTHNTQAHTTDAHTLNAHTHNAHITHTQHTHTHTHTVQTAYALGVYAFEKIYFREFRVEFLCEVRSPTRKAVCEGHTLGVCSNHMCMSATDTHIHTENTWNTYTIQTRRNTHYAFVCDLEKIICGISCPRSAEIVGNNLFSDSQTSSMHVVGMRVCSRSYSQEQCTNIECVRSHTAFPVCVTPLAHCDC